MLAPSYGLKIPSWKCLPPILCSFPRTRTYRRDSSAICSWGLKMRFFRLPKIFLFFASIFSRKNTENHGFWPPKTLPKSFPEGSQNNVPKNVWFFRDFYLIFVVCCRRRTSKFMRPRNVLLAFHKNRMFAFGKHLGPEKPTKNRSKTRPEPFKNRCWKHAVFQQRILGVRASILEPVGPPSWNQVGSKSRFPV